jgi:glycosyltransferase involved in cell wall biosynthesis
MTISAFPVVEAMASDVPVIASGSCRVEIVKDGETGFIVEKNNGLRERMGRAVRCRPRKNFTWERIGNLGVTRW